jgi:hypothetical protein
MFINNNIYRFTLSVRRKMHYSESFPVGFFISSRILAWNKLEVLGTTMEKNGNCICFLILNGLWMVPSNHFRVNIDNG